MKNLTYITLVLLLLSNIAQSQIRTTIFDTKNEAFKIFSTLEASTLSVPTKDIKKIDVRQLLAEDELLKDMDVPFRFGKGSDVNYTLDDGVWSKSNKSKIWSLKIKSEGAYSLNFIFDQLYLPEGVELFIFNPSGTVVYGPVTAEQNLPKDALFLTDLIAGDEAIIQLVEPIEVSEKPSLRISKVVHGYKNMFPFMLQNGERQELSGGLGASASCNNDIACAPTWANESKAVALVLLSSGEEWCSGSLVNNTSQNYRPYFLTAFHCIDSDDSNGIISNNEKTKAQSWMFRFEFKKANCNGSGIIISTTYNRAYFRAGWKQSDFALMELVTKPTGTTWLGWDKSGVTPVQGTSIHHPKGDVMKISFDNNQLSSSSWEGTNNCWLLDFDSGVVEHGSSGAPLFDQNKKIIGQLYGNQYYNPYISYCSQPRAEYGKFHLSWTGGGTNDTRLSTWLDPLNTGQLTTNTLGGISGLDAAYSFRQNTYSLDEGIPAGASIAWSGTSNISFIGGTTGKSVAISICEGTTATLTATVTTSSETYVYSKVIQVNNGELTVAPRLGAMEVWLNHPYAQCYDWKIGSGLLTHINGSYTNGSFTCSNDNDLIFELSGLSGSQSIEVRAQANGCYTPWRAASFQSWAPEIKYEASYLNPMRPEPFYVALAEDYSGASNGAMYYWYFGNQLFDVTGEPYIHSSDWPCGEHTLRVVAVVDGYEAEASTDFWGMCSGWRYAAYPNPVSNLLTVSKQSEAATLSTLSATASVAEKSVSRKVQLYNASHHLVLEQSFGLATELMLNVAGLPNGTYFLNIFENGKVVEQQTVVVKR